MKSLNQYVTLSFRLGMQEYLKTLKKEKSRKDYITAVNEVTDFLKKDFLEIDEKDAYTYLHHLENLAMKEQIMWSTLNNKMAKLHSVSNFFLNHPSFCEMEYTKNPFDNPHRLHKDPMINKCHVLSLQEIDECLKQASDCPELFLAISLSFRMGLSSSDIVNLKTDHFLLDKAENAGLKIKNQIIKVPSDILTLIDWHIKTYHISGYLLTKKNGKAYTTRELQVLFKMHITLPFTLQDIRNTSIAFMKKGGASAEMIAEYMNITTSWLYRYDDIIESLCDSAVDYHCIEVKCFY